MENEKLKIEDIVFDLKEKGLDVGEIVKALEKMVEEQKLTEDEFLEAKKLLEVEDDKEKEEAEKLFGMKF